MSLYTPACIYLKMLADSSLHAKHRPVAQIVSAGTQVGIAIALFAFQIVAATYLIYDEYKAVAVLCTILFVVIFNGIGNYVSDASVKRSLRFLDDLQ